jgi:hypothetical protein
MKNCYRKRGATSMAPRLQPVEPMRSPRWFVACALMSVSACAGRYRTEPVGPVGYGTAFVQPRTEPRGPDATEERPPWATGGGVQLAKGSYELALAFDIPRAQIVDWTVTCPGVELSGSAGEPFATYRTRRIGELRAARGEPENARVASLSSIGLFAVHTEAISDAVATPDVDLPPGDVGAARLATMVRVTTSGPGVCALTSTADDATVVGTFQVRRIDDAQLAPHTTAVEVGGRAHTLLVTNNAEADVQRANAEQARERAQLEAEAQRRVAAEQLHAEEVRAIEARSRTTVDLEQRRLDIALRAREDLRRRWQAWGAIPRPPMPELLAEVAGEPPFPGAVWTPGAWVWMNGRWTWRAGYWSEPDVFDGGDGGEVMVGIETGMDFGFDGGRPVRPEVVDHRRGNRKIRDHRDGDSRDGIVRDHRDYQTSSKPEPTVRDHRNSREQDTKSTVRDHRDDKDDKKDDDRGGNVRDHRRR